MSFILILTPTFIKISLFYKTEGTKVQHSSDIAASLTNTNASPSLHPYAFFKRMMSFLSYHLLNDMPEEVNIITKILTSYDKNGQF